MRRELPGFPRCEGTRLFPFCFWVGFYEPHREFNEGLRVQRGIALTDVEVPGFLPDVSEVRSDVADYAFEIEWQDEHLARILELLDEGGELENTLIVVTSDHGMAFPRAKATLCDAGTRMPLAIRWGEQMCGGRVVDDPVSFVDSAPTFLEAAGLEVPGTVTGQSLLHVLLTSGSGDAQPGRRSVVFGVERHYPRARPNGAGYPMRAIRTQEYPYIRNLQPGSRPVGDRPGPVWPVDDPVGGFADIDGGPSKTFLWEHRE